MIPSLSVHRTGLEIGSMLSEGRALQISTAGMAVIFKGVVISQWGGDRFKCVVDGHISEKAHYVKADRSVILLQWLLSDALG